MSSCFIFTCAPVATSCLFHLCFCCHPGWILTLSFHSAVPQSNMHTIWHLHVIYTLLSNFVGNTPHILRYFRRQHSSYSVWSSLLVWCMVWYAPAYIASSSCSQMKLGTHGTNLFSTLSYIHFTFPFFFYICTADIPLPCYQDSSCNDSQCPISFIQ